MAQRAQQDRLERRRTHAARILADHLDVRGRGGQAGLAQQGIDGSGDFTDGSLDIVSISSAGLVFQFQDTTSTELDVNGPTFTAQLCPGVPGAADSATP